MDIQFIKNLLEEADLFSKQNGQSGDLAAFGAWLEARHKPVIKREAPLTIETGETTESVIGKLLIYLNRYAKAYTKKLLEGSSLGSADEFVFLIYLFNREKATKTELIEMARLEKPTGMEIIRRLLALGLLVQEDNNLDKRSKNLRLTEAGRVALSGCLDRFTELSMLLTGNLDEEEKTQLLRSLQKLEDFHYPLRSEMRDRDWEELVGKVQEII